MKRAGRTLTAAIVVGFWLPGMVGQVAAEGPAPRVSVSVKPLHGLVAAVMTGVGEPSLLFDGGRPPSGAEPVPEVEALLDAATILFWIGPTYERSLSKPVLVRKGRLADIRLLEAPGVRHVEASSRVVTPAAGEGGEADGTAGRDAELPRDRELTGKDLAAVSPDPLIWMDPRNAIAVVRRVAEALGEADPHRASLYRRNASATIVRIEAMDARFTEMIEGVKQHRYATVDGVLRYFESHYDITPATSLDLGGHGAAAAIEEGRARLREPRVACLFASREFGARGVGALARGTGARATLLDPLGADVAAGRTAYFDLMQRLADDFTACLDGDGRETRR